MNNYKQAKMRYRGLGHKWPNCNKRTLNSKKKRSTKKESKNSHGQSQHLSNNRSPNRNSNHNHSLNNNNNNNSSKNNRNKRKEVSSAFSLGLIKLNNKRNLIPKSCAITAIRSNNLNHRNNVADMQLAADNKMLHPSKC